MNKMSLQQACFILADIFTEDAADCAFVVHAPAGLFNSGIWTPQEYQRAWSVIRNHTGAASADVPPLALTDANVALLSAAIEAEGYRIMIDPSTQEVRLEAARDRERTEPKLMPPSAWQAMLRPKRKSES